MKLTIKTLDQKTFHVEFDDTKTVWELKELLSKQPEIAVQPELQQVIYAGRVLVNDHVLQSYSIDERKFLVVMAKKAPTDAQESTTTAAAAVAKKEEKKTEEKKPESKTVETTKEPGPSRRKSTDQPPTVAAATASPAKDKPTTTPSPAAAAPVAATATSATPTTPSQTTSSLLAAADSHTPGTGSDNAELVKNIVSMGYPESEVRRALIASFNNPDRAIEYLIEGIPEIPEMLEAHASASAASDMMQTDAVNPLAFLRQDPRFNEMRRVIQQRPELVSTLLAKIGETNPALLTVIRENQEEFLRMLNENVDEGGIDAAGLAAVAAAGEAEENVVEVVLTDAERLAVERLVGLGFPREIVVRAYIACEKNEEQTADFLCRHMEDN